MFTANALANKTNLTVYTVRHYTKIGLLEPVKNSINGYKVYQESDITRLKFIIAAKELGFTLHEIINILNDAEKGNSPCPSVRKIIVHHIEENRRKIQELQKQQTKMESALKDWEKLQDSLPTGNSVCHLIESVGND